MNGYLYFYAVFELYLYKIGFKLKCIMVYCRKVTLIPICTRGIVFIQDRSFFQKPYRGISVSYQSEHFANMLKDFQTHKQQKYLNDRTEKQIVGYNLLPFSCTWIDCIESSLLYFCSQNTVNRSTLYLLPCVCNLHVKYKDFFDSF